MSLMTGKIYWAKVVGKPFNKYQSDEKEWSFDLSVDKKTMKQLISEGVPKESFKNKGNEQGDFLKFARNAVNRDSAPAQPFRIVDAQGNDWGNELIGNGSTVNIKYVLNEKTYKGKNYLKPACLAIQVWDHVKYQPKSPFPSKGVSTEQDDTSVAPTGKDW